MPLRYTLHASIRSRRRSSRSVLATPIYRVVNASDAVPRIPFGYGYVLLVRLLKLVLSFLPTFQFLNRLYVYMDKISGYVHYGDER